MPAIYTLASPVKEYSRINWAALTFSALQVLKSTYDQTSINEFYTNKSQKTVQTMPMNNL